MGSGPLIVQCWNKRSYISCPVFSLRRHPEELIPGQGNGTKIQIWITIHNPGIGLISSPESRVQAGGSLS
ncbi:hypothetical protein GOODEAATRI_003104 [Goodea atripinnis]|uniref:Ycf15 n=1 Tax=Goodea atripinnis TaxID=208336 RepID=A0ABV0P184_9TELE